MRLLTSLPYNHPQIRFLWTGNDQCSRVYNAPPFGNVYYFAISTYCCAKPFSLPSPPLPFELPRPAQLPPALYVVSFKAMTAIGIHYPAGKGYHFRDGPYVEYIGKIDKSMHEEVVSKLQAEMNRLIQADIPTQVHMVRVLCTRSPLPTPHSPLFKEVHASAHVVTTPPPCILYCSFRGFEAGLQVHYSHLVWHEQSAIFMLVSGQLLSHAC